MTKTQNEYIDSSAVRVRGLHICNSESLGRRKLQVAPSSSSHQQYVPHLLSSPNQTVKCNISSQRSFCSSVSGWMCFSSMQSSASTHTQLHHHCRALSLFYLRAAIELFLCVCVWFTGSELMFVIKEQKKRQTGKKRQKKVAAVAEQD